MTDAMWGGVRERVRALAERPVDDRVFGARGHQFRLADPLTPDGVAEL